MRGDDACPYLAVALSDVLSAAEQYLLVFIRLLADCTRHRILDRASVAARFAKAGLQRKILTD